MFRTDVPVSLVLFFWFGVVGLFFFGGAAAAQERGAAGRVCDDNNNNDDDAADGTGGVCLPPSSSNGCGFPASYCGGYAARGSSSPSPPPSPYRGGGSAQAYKPDAPTKSVVCDPSIYGNSTRKQRQPQQQQQQQQRYKAASWPYSRWSHGGNAPTLSFEVTVFGCSEEEQRGDNEKVEGAGSGTTCCCKPLEASDNDNDDDVVVQLEAWQARPDGTYSSLRAGVDDGDCRATVPLPHSESSSSSSSSSRSPSPAAKFEFDTVAPGSTGALGGLGPSKLDFPPYGPPVLHLLVTATSTARSDGYYYAPTLVDVPLPLNTKTTERRPFRWTDWRGSAWAKDAAVGGRGGKRGLPYDIVSWTAAVDSDHGAKAKIGLNVYLQRRHRSGSDAGVDESGAKESLERLFCRSPAYGLLPPTSFFLEPIAVCAPSMLDFFAL